MLILAIFTALLIAVLACADLITAYLGPDDLDDMGIYI